MNHIDVGNYSAGAYIETVHGGRLEFVLSDRAVAEGLEHDRYWDLLWDLANEGLRSFGAGVSEVSTYGSIHFLVTAPDFPALQRALDTLASIVAKWKVDHQIDILFEFSSYRVWPDGTVQDVEETAHSWMSDDWEEVRALSEEDALAKATCMREGGSS